MDCVNHPQRDARFPCSRCRRNFCVECVTWQEGHLLCRQCQLDPTRDKEAQFSSSGVVPAWEQRDSLFDVDAIFATVKEVLSRPTATFSAMKTEGGLSGPLAYALVLGTIGTLFSLLWEPVQLSFLPVFGLPNPGPQAVPPVVLITIALISPLVIAAGIFLSAGIAHLCLALLGSARLPFEATFRVYCYANGSVALLQVVPFCGGLVAIAWSGILYVIGLAAVHRISITRATVALALPLIACCTCLGVVVGTVLAGPQTSLLLLPVSLHCPFHALTGLPCPTCGGLRALGSLARMEVSQAFLWNPLVCLGALASLPGALLTVRMKQSGFDLLAELGKPTPRMLVGAVVAVNWLYLLLAGR